MCVYQTTVILSGNKVTAVIFCKTVSWNIHFPPTSSFMFRKPWPPIVGLPWIILSIYLICSDAVPSMGRDSVQTLYLFRLQKRALRIVFHRCQSISVLHINFVRIDILTFPSIYILESLSFFIANHNLFTSHVHRLNTKASILPSCLQWHDLTSTQHFFL